MTSWLGVCSLRYCEDDIAREEVPNDEGRRVAVRGHLVGLVGIRGHLFGRPFAERPDDARGTRTVARERMRVMAVVPRPAISEREALCPCSRREGGG